MVVEEADKVQEMVDEITQKEPKGYLYGIPVYASDFVPIGKIYFISKSFKPDPPWMLPSLE